MSYCLAGGIVLLFLILLAALALCAGHGRNSDFFDE